jgi:hypothetical protein
MLRNSLESSESAADADRRPCASCGYDLRGLSEPRCPECGIAFDPTELSLAEIPWLCRNQLNIGAIEAYARTVWLVLFHPRRFASQVHRPCQIGMLEVRLFTTVSIWIATVSFIGALVIASWLSRFPPARLAVADLLPNLLIVGPGALVFFTIATRVDSRPVSVSMRFAEEIRYRRLAHFCCAALGLMPIVPIAALMAGALPDPNAVATTMMLSLSAVGLLWWISGVVYCVLGGEMGPRRATGQAISQLFLFFAAGVVGIFVMVPLAMLTGIILSIIRG